MKWTQAVHWPAYPDKSYIGNRWRPNHNNKTSGCRASSTYQRQQRTPHLLNTWMRLWPCKSTEHPSSPRPLCIFWRWYGYLKPSRRLRNHNQIWFHQITFLWAHFKYGRYFIHCSSQLIELVLYFDHGYLNAFCTRVHKILKDKVQYAFSSAYSIEPKTIAATQSSPRVISFEREDLDDKESLHQWYCPETINNDPPIHNPATLLLCLHKMWFGQKIPIHRPMIKQSNRQDFNLEWTSYTATDKPRTYQ